MATVSTRTFNRDLPECTGSNIRKLREELDMSYKDLGTLVGVSASYINRIEHGERRRVSYKILENLAQIFDVSISELLGVECNDRGPTVAEQKHLIFEQMKCIVSEVNLTHQEKIQQLRAIADICQFLLINRI